MELWQDIMKTDMKQALAFDPAKDYDAWRKALREKFVSLLGLDAIEANAATDPALEIESEEKKDGYVLTRFTFASEEGTRVPCYLAVPDTGKETYPTVITLQGHSTGFHNSVGIVQFDRDAEYQPRGCFALQAVAHGYAALCIEQRGMGERCPTEKNRGGRTCAFTAMRSLMMGRTVLGERVFDISRAIDVLANFPVCDTTRLVVTGNSGGGTATYYAACYDERIQYAVPSCAFCTYKASILDMSHCTCNYIPNAYRYFEMQDLAALIAPRHMTVIAGVEDNIFPIEGVREGFETVKRIYEKAGAKDQCHMIETPKNHWWCVDIVWPEIDRLIKGE
ncbi:MAG: acetylxylan esterase [Clostridia bacterium]|nr:acetylxylan esterase [Clostridia bacterium]